MVPSMKSAVLLAIFVSISVAQFKNDGRIGFQNTNFVGNPNGIHGNDGGIVTGNNIRGNNGAVYDNNVGHVIAVKGKINNGDHFQPSNLNNGYHGNSFGSFQEQSAKNGGFIPRRINVIPRRNDFHGRTGITGNIIPGNNGIIGDNFHGDNGIVGNGGHINTGIHRNGLVGNSFHPDNGIVGNVVHGNNGIHGNDIHGNNGIVGNVGHGNSFVHGNRAIIGNNFHGNDGIVGNVAHGDSGFHGKRGIIGNNFHGNNIVGNVGHANNGKIGNAIHGNGIVGNNQFVNGKERIVGGFVKNQNGIVGDFGKHNAVVNNNFHGGDIHGNDGITATLKVRNDIPGNNFHGNNDVIGNNLHGNIAGSQGIGQTFHGIGSASNQFSRGVIVRQMPGRGFGKSVHNGINNGINHGFVSNIGGRFNNGLKGGNFVGSGHGGIAGPINGRIHGGLNDHDLKNIQGPVNLGGVDHVQQTHFNNGRGSFGKFGLIGQHADADFNDRSFGPNNNGVKFNDGFGTYSNDKFGSDFESLPVKGKVITANPGFVGRTSGVHLNNGLIGNNVHGNSFVPSRKELNLKNGQKFVNQGNVVFASPVRQITKPVSQQFVPIQNRGVSRFHGGQSGRLYNGQQLNNGVNSFNGVVVKNVGRNPFIQQAVGISGFKTRDVIGNQNHGFEFGK